MCEIIIAICHLLAVDGDTGEPDCIFTRVKCRTLQYSRQISRSHLEGKV